MKHIIFLQNKNVNVCNYLINIYNKANEEND